MPAEPQQQRDRDMCSVATCTDTSRLRSMLKGMPCPVRHSLLKTESDTLKAGSCCCGCCNSALRSSTARQSLRAALA
jgi:hypothetical protein